MFIVIGSAVLMQYAGLSMAMGAFIAGVMLAESSYRHELEADIEPFRGILLGLFFIAVGLAVDLGIVWDNIFVILALVPALMLAKAVTIYGLCRLFGSDHNEAVRVGLILPQHGEFGFVLFSAAASAALLSPEESSFLIAVVTISMALTPLCMRLVPLLIHHDEAEQMDEDFDGAESQVLMIGFSRMGQIAAQALLAGGCGVTVLDNSAQRVRQAENFGFRIYFGDGTRKDVLRMAGIEKAKLVAVTTQYRETTDRVVEMIASEFPDVPIYTRSYDRGHALDLLEKYDLWQIRETFESALVMGRALLEGMGFSEDEAMAIVDDVRERDKKRLESSGSEGIMAGRDHLHNAPVPEPLINPDRKRRWHEPPTEHAEFKDQAGAKTRKTPPLERYHEEKAAFTTGSTMRHVVVMTATSSVGLVSIFFVDAINLFYIALLGQQALAAAIGYAATIMFFSISVCIGVSIATAALVGRTLGAGDVAESRELATASLVYLVAMQRCFAAFLFPLLPFFPRSAGCGGRNARPVVQFMQIVVPSIPLLGLGMCLGALLRAKGDPRRAMFVTLAGGAAALVLDPLFIFGFDLGLTGAAIATFCVRIVLVIVGLHGVWKVHDMLGPLSMRAVKAYLAPFFGIALPAIATQLATPVGNAYVTGVIAEFGDDAVAGWAIVGRIMPVAFGVIFALSGAVGPIMSQNYGAKLFGRVTATLCAML